jgi:hypothetical protein
MGQPTPVQFEGKEPRMGPTETINGRVHYLSDTAATIREDGGLESLLTRTMHDRPSGRTFLASVGEINVS